MGHSVPFTRKVSAAEAMPVCLVKLTTIGGNVIQVSVLPGAHVSEDSVSQGTGNQ